MSAHLLILYPTPKDAKAFDRAYRDEHLPYAGPRLMKEGATNVTTKRVLGSPGGTPAYHWISFIDFPAPETAKACAKSQGGQEALQHAASISSGGQPQYLLIGETK